MTKRIALGLQGGGSHGAFTWGVLDRLLEAAERGEFEIAAISGASAGAINATVAACGLAEGGPALARTRLDELWRLIALRGALSGNGLIYGAPGPFGLNIDWNPGAIALEALGLVVSPYTNPFYRDALGPLLAELLPPERLRSLESAGAPRVFATAVDVATNLGRNFTQPHITIDALRASACLPTEFQAVEIDGATYWDGGFIGNPSLDPLLDQADDLLLIMANSLTRADTPKGARAILDRVNEITFNASVVLEINGIEAINAMLRELKRLGIAYDGKYRPIRLHAIRDDPFLGSLGAVSKSSTSWRLLSALHEAGQRAGTAFLADGADLIGVHSSPSIKRDLLGIVRG